MKYLQALIIRSHKSPGDTSADMDLWLKEFAGPPASAIDVAKELRSIAVKNSLTS